MLTQSYRKVGQHDDCFRRMARYLGDMVDRVEEIGVAGNVGRPTIHAVSLCYLRISRCDDGATDISAARNQRGHKMATALLADEIEPMPAEIRLEPCERHIDQRYFARTSPVEMVA